MTANDALTRGRSLAEDATELKLKSLVGQLLLLGRIQDGEPFVARGIVVTAPVDRCELGLVVVRFSRVIDALTTSMCGWVIGRVAHGSRLVGPVADDVALARRRLIELGLNPSRSV